MELLQSSLRTGHSSQRHAHRNDVNDSDFAAPPTLDGPRSIPYSIGVLQKTPRFELQRAAIEYKTMGIQQARQSYGIARMVTCYQTG